LPSPAAGPNSNALVAPGRHSAFSAIQNLVDISVRAADNISVKDFTGAF
jgi:hypothetical protein